MALTNFLKDIADAIRYAEQSNAPINAQQFATRIRALSGGQPIPPEPSELLYKVAVFSDQHTTKPTADTDWVAFTNLAKSENVLALVGCGDLSADGDEEEMNMWKEMRDANRGTIPCYTCNGNHESKSVAGYMKFHPELMRQYLDSDYTTETVNYFVKDIGGDIYAFIPIFEGTSEHKSSVMFSDTVLTWLENMLEEYRNRRVFLFAHIPPDYHYIPNGFGGVELYQSATAYEWGYTTDGSGYPRADRTKFLELLAHYKNAIWFNGHTHVSFKEAEEEGNTNICYARYNTDGAMMIHIPSLTIPRTIDYGELSGQLTELSECIIMDAYANKVVLRYKDLINNVGKDYEIDTTIVPIEPKPSVALTSISATKTKTSYEVGDTLDTSDIVTKATYSDGSKKTVVGSYNTSAVNMSQSGNYSIVVSYTENGITKTTNVSITVASVEPEPSYDNWTFTLGTKIDMNTGAESSDSTYGASDFIPCTSRSITVSLENVFAKGGSAVTSYPRVYICCYDANKNWVGTPSTSAYASPTTSKTFTAPTSLGQYAYIRLRANCNYTDNCATVFNPTNVHITDA